MALLLRKFVNLDAHARFYFSHPCRWRVILIPSKKFCKLQYFALNTVIISFIFGVSFSNFAPSGNVLPLHFLCISLQTTYSYSY